VASTFCLFYSPWLFNFFLNYSPFLYRVVQTLSPLSEIHEASREVGLFLLFVSHFLRSLVKRLIQKNFQDSDQGDFAVAGVFFIPFLFYKLVHFEREDFSMF
jgi:hypothetical protein